MVDFNNFLLPCEKENEKEAFCYQLREAYAKKMSSIIWGNGFVFQSENQKVLKAFKKFDKLNKLGNMFSFIERYLSLYGRCIITINKSETNDIFINVPNPFYFNGLGKVFVSPQLAVIWQKFTIDMGTFVVKSTYDSKKVVNEIYTHSDNKTIRVYDKETEILEQLRIKKVWEHNFGFVPVVEFTNISFFQFFFNNFEFVKITDWYCATWVEDLIWTTIKNLKKELKYCHSRIIVDNADQSMIKRIHHMMGNDANDFIIETETGGEFKTQPGNGDFTKYTSTIDNLMDFYFKFCGSSRFSEGGGAQKTVAETSSIRSQMIESVNNKITLREEQVIELLRKVLFAMGAISGDFWSDKQDEFTFEISGNILKDESTWIDNMLKLMEIGACSIVDIIQKVFNITAEEAKEKFKQIKEFNTENNIINAMFINETKEAEAESSFNQETGIHKDSAKNGVA